MGVTLKITSATEGEFDFSQYRQPLFSRRIGYIRGEEQGASLRKIDCKLTGYFAGNKNDQVMEQIEKLIRILKSNRVTLLYNDGVRDIVNQQVWVAEYSDPDEWRNYIGNYSIGLYYWEEAIQPVGELLSVSFVTDSTYNFSPPPTINHSIKVNRSSHRQPRKTLTGQPIGDLIQLTLEGYLKGTDANDLNNKRQLLLNAFSQDGILNYGPLTYSNARVGTRTIPSVFPLDHLQYSIELFVDSPTGITEFESSREFSRLHNNPLIRERPYCGPPSVTLLATSGQTVNYHMRIVGYDIPTIRSLLQSEAALLIYPGGTELPGGKEVWNDQEVSVTLDFSKFYTSPVVGNITGSG